MNAAAEPGAAPSGLWDPEALWAKAVSYAARAIGEPRDSQWFPFFSSLVLEYVGRSVLAKIHPVLLADPRNEENLFYAFGAGKTSRPISIPAHTVFSRCVRFVEPFTDEMATACNAVAERRNEELHTGGLPFDSLDSSAWLPRLYRSLRVLCDARGTSFEDLLGPEEAEIARRLIAAADEATVSAVKERLGRARAFAEGLRAEERKPRASGVEWPDVPWNRSWTGVPCPGCGEEGRVLGALAHTQVPRLEGDSVVEAEVYVRDEFMCAVCDLHLNGDLELDAAGLAGSFTRESVTDADDYYAERYADAMADDYGNC